MTHCVIGESTKTIYAKGSRADCMRKLQQEFPEHIKQIVNGRNAAGNILPETMIIIRKEL